MGGSRWGWVLQIKFLCHKTHLSLIIIIRRRPSSLARKWSRYRNDNVDIIKWRGDSERSAELQLRSRLSSAPGRSRPSCHGNCQIEGPHREPEIRRHLHSAPESWYKCHRFRLTTSDSMREFRGKPEKSISPLRPEGTPFAALLRKVLQCTCRLQRSLLCFCVLSAGPRPLECTLDAGSSVGKGHINRKGCIHCRH